jgi:hypothetical protein
MRDWENIEVEKYFLHVFKYILIWFTCLFTCLPSHSERFVLQVNCAGIIELGNIENTSLEQYDRLFNSNVR